VFSQIGGIENGGDFGHEIHGDGSFVDTG
jgi:hypothetical protein